MRACCTTLVVAVIWWSLVPQYALADREVISLNGSWQFRAEEEGSTWKSVTLPARFEEHEGIEFDGIGTYRRVIPPLVLPRGKRAILHFQAAATLAEVSINSTPLGSHLGGWTPFRFDVTDLVRAASPGTQLELMVRLDEKVGHNSQGFLPIVAPHFGGIWQDIRLLIVSDAWLDDLSLLSVGDMATSALRIEARLNRGPALSDMRMAVRYRLSDGNKKWSPVQVFPVSEARNVANDATAAMLDKRSGVISLRCPVEDKQLWSPASPTLYDVEIELQALVDGQYLPLDQVLTRAAFRTFQVEGQQLALNGQPVSIRGVLNWGYAPPRLGPSVDEQHMREELEVARSCGFNLMKFCLWIPPKRYLELADEMGMMTWVEYPTWHSKWTADQLPTLQREFGEFFQFDRNHPSVVLRSLTCETGPSADLDVIQALYDRCHAMIPGSVVEDDSSWIGWNRVHDFYDDHPYGNNHTWVSTLDRLKQHIAEREKKPLVLGEAIAADTWVDCESLLEVVGEERPFWLPGFLDGNREWLERMDAVAGPIDTSRMANDSKHFAFLMRKYQIETYRREVPSGGYVVSVIRDFPLASMGLLDYLGRPKWPAPAWRWHKETMILLETAADRRSYSSGEVLEANLIVSHFGAQPIKDAKLTAIVHVDGGKIIARETTRRIGVDTGSVERVFRLTTALPDVTQPTQFFVRVELESDSRTFENAWPLWVLPSAQTDPDVVLHRSCSEEKRQLFPNAKGFGGEDSKSTVVASRLDRPLIDFMESGGRVLLLPDGERGSFPLNNVWFLRGGPFIADLPLAANVPRDLLVELQHFDLAGPVVPDIGYLDQISPILMFWDNHDLKRVKTHGLVFETRVGQGRLLVSALNHTSSTNSVGRWLLGRLLHHLDKGSAPKHAMSANTVKRMREKIDEDKIELVQRPWQFKPDPDNDGLTREWHTRGFEEDETWKAIQIGTAWEGLGYAALDGWAWYRIAVDVPKSWSDKPVYVSFEGVDDYYELYVNGQLAGSGGDIETKTTAFEDRTSHLVTDFVQPGQAATIAVRVYDWQGSGGLFRPVSVGTAALGNGETEVLK